MLIISGTVHIKADKIEDAIAAGLEMSRASEAEDGCLHYRFYRDLEDETLFFLYEMWENEDALKAHFQTPHMATFSKAMGDILAAPPQVKRYDVSNVTDL